MGCYLYVYGTLRPNTGETVEVSGVLYDLGHFPGIRLGGPGKVVCEKIEIPDETRFDQYEGYFPDDHEASLYIRRPFMDGFIYEFNRFPVSDDKIIHSGDWLEHKKQKKG